VTQIKERETIGLTKEEVERNKEYDKAILILSLHFHDTYYTNKILKLKQKEK
jgi:hypothetical protein